MMHGQKSIECVVSEYDRKALTIMMPWTIRGYGYASIEWRKFAGNIRRFINILWKSDILQTAQLKRDIEKERNLSHSECRDAFENF
jgi:hypothetical protein